MIQLLQCHLKILYNAYCKVKLFLLLKKISLKNNNNNKLLGNS